MGMLDDYIRRRKLAKMGQTGTAAAAKQHKDRPAHEMAYDAWDAHQKNDQTTAGGPPPDINRQRGLSSSFFNRKRI